MRVLIQRVTRAQVAVGESVCGEIGRGLLLLVGVEDGDERDDIDWLVGKVSKMRIFDDAAGVMNLDVVQTGGSILAVSQFTLHASTRKGNRPSYIRAAGEGIAKPVYESFVQELERASGIKVETGVFGADMQVSLVNDGPVTIWVDSKLRE